MSNNKTLALERVISSMRLRVPQKEALERFHEIMNRSELTLSAMSVGEVSELFKNENPTWVFDHDAPEFTFHLATGVGKTRLIGAVMAYLFIAKESQNFVIVSPRSEIVRKFLAICGGGEGDYIFVDPSLVDYPSLFQQTSSVGDYDQNSMFAGGPRIWVLSPQALTANNARMKNKGEFDSCSPVEYLQKLDDLVIFFDESHHLGLDAEEDSIWRTELTSLNPKMIIGTTASIEEGQNNIIYSYPLNRCLNEHKYTKFVRIMPDKKSDVMSDEEYDHLTLRFALQQLEIKQKYINDYCRLNNITQKVKATMLVACVDILHAEATTKWLQNYLESRSAVLLVHSKLNENEFVPALKSIERVESPVKIVVNVGMLNEGWDVSNIYVIVPLRTMASTTLVTQIMGRGLRLPFGEQVGDIEVDTLDVLCFGRETMQEIITNLINKGFGTGDNRGITVDPSVNSAHPEEEFVPKKKIKLEVVKGEREIHIPQFRPNKTKLPLDEITIPSLKEQEIHYFMINDPKTIKRLGNKIQFEREEFVKMVTSEILKQCKYLNFAREYAKIKAMVSKFLQHSRCTEDIIKLDPARVITHIKNCLEQIKKQLPVSYVKWREDMAIDFCSIQVSVPETYEYPNSNLMSWKEWSNRKHKGIPFGGWKRCKYEAMPFDTGTEYKIAKIIDTCDEVETWFRNLPGIITLVTPVGNYSPDFAIFLSCDDKNILLEIKDDDRFGREDQDATIKANAAREWCKVQTEASLKPWEYWLLLDSDAKECETFDDIRDCVD